MNVEDIINRLIGLAVLGLFGTLIYKGVRKESKALADKRDTPGALSGRILKTIFIVIIFYIVYAFIRGVACWKGCTT